VSRVLAVCEGGGEVLLLLDKERSSNNRKSVSGVVVLLIVVLKGIEKRKILRFVGVYHQTPTHLAIFNIGN